MPWLHSGGKFVGAPQEMRTYLEAEAAGKAVGFELVDSRDIAHTSPPAGHW